MKGLLTKDFALFLQRKRTFLFLAAWAVVMCITMDSGSFVIGWMTVISSFFTTSSMAYDEYDNCYPFLMSLPIDAKVYALEKYIFGFTCGFGAWLFSTIIVFAISCIKGSAAEFSNEFIPLLMFIPIFMFLIDVNLPINIKFGSERGRTIILIMWGVAFGVVFISTKLLKLSFSFDSISINEAGIVGIAFAACVILSVLSAALSINFMQQKEF